tara:strand:+ start:80 stop:439 length:360 start_codon:yes stop_codon:yes gene_type:complete
MATFGQIMIDKKNKKNPQIDITKFDRKYIEIDGYGNTPNSIYYGKQDKKGKKIKFNIRRKKTKIYDGDKLVKFYSSSDIIEYFTKYGYEYEGSAAGGTSTNYQTKQTYIRTVMTFKKID